MSVHDVHFSHSVFSLSGVPLCGQGPWCIRQTPSGLGQCLALMKIKSIITQKIRVGSPPALSLLCLVIWLRVNTYVTGSIKVWIGFKDTERWKNSLASPFDSWNFHLGIDPGWSGAHFDSLPRKTDRQRLRKNCHLQAKYFGLIPENMDSTFDAQCDLGQITHTHTHTHTHNQINLTKIRENKYTTVEVRWGRWP